MKQPATTTFLLAIFALLASNAAVSWGRSLGGCSDEAAPDKVREVLHQYQPDEDAPPAWRCGRGRLFSIVGPGGSLSVPYSELGLTRFSIERESSLLEDKTALIKIQAHYFDTTTSGWLGRAPWTEDECPEMFSDCVQIIDYANLRCRVADLTRAFLRCIDMAKVARAATAPSTKDEGGSPVSPPTDIPSVGMRS